jgi:hypothetical protein
VPPQDQELEKLVVEILEEENAVAVTVGIFRQRLEHQYGIEMNRSELTKILDDLVEEGVLKYNHGEFGEYALPE